MATVDDIGVPGQPLSTPPLTEWQAAVRDAINATTGADAWVSWSPTLSGFTASTVDASYHRTPGGLLTVSAKFTVSAVTGTAGFTIPVDPVVDAAGSGFAHDVGSVRYPLTAYAAAGAGTVYLYMHKSDAANASLAGFTASTPFTWAAGDVIVASIHYKCAPTP